MSGFEVSQYLSTISSTAETTALSASEVIRHTYAIQIRLLLLLLLLISITDSILLHTACYCKLDAHIARLSCV